MRRVTRVLLVTMDGAGATIVHGRQAGVRRKGRIDLLTYMCAFFLYITDERVCIIETAPYGAAADPPYPPKEKRS
jgi:hypothetical protein